MRAERREAGFTLVEVLVALVATSLLLAIIMNGAVEAREREARAEARREAALLARELVARTGVAPFSDATRQGEVRGLRWTVSETAAARDPRSRFILSAIAVTVRSDDDVLLFSGETRRIKPGHPS